MSIRKISKLTLVLSVFIVYNYLLVIKKREGVINLPIIIKAKKNQSTGDIIRQFKKASAGAGTVQIVKDRRYFAKPSRLKATATAERSRLKKRAHSLKKRKNVSPNALARIQQRLGA